MAEGLLRQSLGPGQGRMEILENDGQGGFIAYGDRLPNGLADQLRSQGALFGDYDNDGDLDLYIGRMNHARSDPTLRNDLFRNQGDGTFAKVTREAGLDVDLHPGDKVHYGGSASGMVSGDFDGDGWPDLYLGVLLSPNRLFLNDRQGGFRDATTDEIADEGGSFGVAIGDIDGDGALDIFQAAGSFGDLGFRSLMLLNRGQGQFLDITESAGFAALGANNVLGPSLRDLDNDGDLDLLTTLPHTLFLNNGDGTFVDRTETSGLPRPMVYSTVALDYNLDGFLDLGVRGDTDFQWGGLFRHNGNSNHWLRVELVGRESNRSGIGARLIATTGPLQQTREVHGGDGFAIDELTAHW